MLVLGAGTALLACATACAAAQTPTLTRWGRAVDAAHSSVWPEYPRPGMVRSSWQNLNGVWQYAILAGLPARARGPHRADTQPAAMPRRFDGTIVVPYPIGSRLSGVERTLQRGEHLWYQRSLNFAAPDPDRSVLLHFEAIDAPATILFIGDVVGGLGRRTLLGLLPGLREELAPDAVVVNGENAAGGLGITPKIADELFAAGVDVITLGNHTYRQKAIYPYLDEQERILRPANYLRSQPGHGSCLVPLGETGATLGVVNVSGNLFLQAGRPMFAETDAAPGGE